MARRLDYTLLKRADQTYIVNDHGETDVSFFKLKDRCRADIQRNYPDLSPAAVEALVRKRMARAYRPYRPTG